MILCVYFRMCQWPLFRPRKTKYNFYKYNKFYLDFFSWNSRKYSMIYDYHVNVE